MLSQAHIDIVKSTVPLLETAGTTLTEHFYQRLFRHHPQLQHVFNMSHQHSGRQSFALYSAVAAYAKHLDTPEVLADMVERIAHKHSSLNVRAEHYPIVGHHLIETLRELLPQQFTPELEKAWVLAYQQLAGLFIGRENAIYQQNEQRLGGWSGPREFILVEKRIESELVKSLVFEPVDGAPVVDYQPGQYIGIEVQPKGLEYREIRQYSLSSKPMLHAYQISVKREMGDIPGRVSNYLHDDLRLGEQVTLHAPAGDFFLDDSAAPLILVSAGVGITPMQSMLEYVAEHQPQRPVFFLHACEHPTQHSFRRQQQTLVNNMDLTLLTWYRQGADHPQAIQAGRMYAGMMALEHLPADELPLTQAEVYLCGPTAFMASLCQQFRALGVDAQRIHYEVFGPHQTL
jgi:nitric oxide dioxygenase